MTISAWPLDAVNGAPTYSGRVLRQTANAPSFAGASAARPLGAMSGVRPGTSPSSVTATSTTWTCAPLAGVIDGESAAEAGPYTFASDANVSGSITAANASNPRTDIVYVQVSDPAESDGSAAPGVTIAYLAGAAGPNATVPSTPARSFVLARINVPKSGGGSPSVTWVAPAAVAAGGIVPAVTSFQLTALTPVAGTYVDLTTTTDPVAQPAGLYRGNGTAWVPVTADSGWLPVPQQSTGYNANTGTPPAVAKMGRDVRGRGQMNRGTSTVTDGDRLMTLPVGWRPGQDTVISVTGATGSPIRLKITAATGNVNVFGPPSVSVTYVILDDFRFTADQ